MISSNTRPRAGMYSGTFDPPTRAHLAIMAQVIRKKGFEKLVVVVNEAGSRKVYRCSAKERREMILEGLPRDVAKAVDVRIEPERGKSALFADLRADDRYDWYGVIGDDSFESLPADVRSERRWLVVDRSGQLAHGSAPGLVEHMNVGPIGEGVSSSQVRTLLAEGRDAGFLLTPPVARLIGARGYYVTPEGAALASRAQQFNATWNLLTGARAAMQPPFVPQQSAAEHENYMRRYLAGRLEKA